MINHILDIFFPKSCCICNRVGSYMCDRCKKQLKRNLPECYICRRVSNGYYTHENCQRNKRNSLDRVFVGWEYNKMSSEILKRYKYKGVEDIEDVISSLFTDTIISSSFSKYLDSTVLIPVPISEKRLKERGFNQVGYISEYIGRTFNIRMTEDYIGVLDTGMHQAMKSKDERIMDTANPFFVKESFDLGRFKSITLVDDVVTTGSTLEKVSETIRKDVSIDIPIQAMCMFRGKPYY